MSGCLTGSLSFSRRIAARDSNPETSRPASISPTASAFFTPSRIATTDAARIDGSASMFDSREDTSDRADVARERVLLQIEEELLERVGTAPRGADEFSLWQEEVLGRRGPSVATAHSRGPSKKVPT